jgi:hypothetical protein
MAREKAGARARGVGSAVVGYPHRQTRLAAAEHSRAAAEVALPVLVQHGVQTLPHEMVSGQGIHERKPE